VRKDWYRCEGCGCRLDPGEGRMCDECREVQKIRYNQIKAEKDGQYRMILAHASK